MLPGSVDPPLTAFGSHHVAFYYQFVDQAGQGAGPETFGAAFVDYRVRYLFPTFIAGTSYGTPLVGRQQTLTLTGISPGLIPNIHSLEDFSNKIKVNNGSADPALYGIATLRNQRDILYVQNNYWIAEQFSTPRVYNKSQFVSPFPYQNTNGDPAGYGSLTIINRNRVLTTFGHQDSRFSFYAADVYNNARAIQPIGITTLWGTALVAYRNRTVVPTGFDAFYSGPYHIVYNLARIVSTVGFREDTLGLPVVFNRNRTVKQFFPYEGGTFGTPFVAYRIRYVGPFPFNDIPAAYPEVRFNPYPVRPLGIDSYRTGGHDLYIHFNIVAPKSVNVPIDPTIGQPLIENRNKTIGPYAYEQTTFGSSTIQNHKRYILASVGNTNVFGLTLVEDARRRVGPQPFSSHVVSVFAQVRNVIPDPPGQQTIIVPEGSVSSQFGNPSMGYQTLFLVGIAPPGPSFHSVRTNDIRPPSLPYDDYVGTPSLISARYIYPEQVPYPAPSGAGESDLFTSKPRLSPNTIYAPGSDQATQQAKNNNGGAGQVIDQELFGGLRIEFKNRTIYPLWNSGEIPDLKTLWGNASVDLRTRRIYPSPVRGFRAGDLNTNRAQELLNVSVGTTSAFGSTLVYDPAYIPHIAPSGIEPLMISLPDITLKNRRVNVLSTEEQTLWGLPLMGYTRRPEFQGYVATQWGVPRVEYRNRFLHPVGNDMFLSANTLYGFNQRMRVSRINPKVQPVGFQATMFGIATIT